MDTLSDGMQKALKMIKHQMQEEVGCLKNERNNLQTKNREIEAVNANLEKSSEEKDKQITQLKKDNEQLEATNNELKHRGMVVEIEKIACEKECLEIRQKLKSYENHVKELKDTIEKQSSDLVKKLDFINNMSFVEESEDVIVVRDDENEDKATDESIAVKDQEQQVVGRKTRSTSMSLNRCPQKELRGGGRRSSEKRKKELPSSYLKGKESLASDNAMEQNEKMEHKKSKSNLISTGLGQLEDSVVNEKTFAEISPKPFVHIERIRTPDTKDTDDKEPDVYVLDP